jgi:23S rRNA (guanine745-N1)-methyltransferase
MINIGGSVMSIFQCPVCGQILMNREKANVCENNHSFDKAASGYVNLLPPKASSGVSGDSREMAMARRAFLSGGYYAQLSQQINAKVSSLLKDIENPSVLDAGCGEGYYTNNLYIDLAKKHEEFTLAGIDISRDSVKYASKLNHNIPFAVASIFHLPVADESCNAVISIFAPCSDEEFSRVLSQGGYLITVIPGKRHLFGLKEVVYDAPYENDEQGYPLPDFKLIDRSEIGWQCTIGKNEDISNLFLMTPYFWKSPAEGSERLKKLDMLTTDFAFIISVYQKI